MGTPLELVKYNVEDGKFVVGKEAVEVLRKVHSPLGVVAVCGRARQGKSYILNNLLKHTGNGFTVGPTHRPCTKGLWMWSEPQPRTAPDGTKCHLVLLDTEGIDAWDQTAQYSTQIFSLAVLLSSLFVYNQMGGIDESALDRLSLVTEMTKHIRVKAGGGNERLGDFSPAFLWLLRDFYLRLEEDGHKVTPQDYLETALLPVPGTGPSVVAKNQIRASIKALFPDRDCFTMVRPMNDEQELVNLDSVPPEKLRPEFRSGVTQLVDLVFSKAQPKKFGNTFMTGPVLAGLVDAYVQALNNGAVPTIATAWQGVAESESRRAAEAAEAAYHEAFNPDTNAEEADLDREHERCLKVAAAVFNDVAVGDEGIKAAHEAKFRTAVGTRFSDVRARKLAEASSAVNELLYKANVAVNQACQSGATLADVQDRMAALIEQYVASAAGPTKWQRLAEFLRDTYGGLTRDMVARADKAGLAAVEGAAAETAAARAEVAAAVKRAEQAEAQLVDARAECDRLARKIAELGGEAGNAKARAEAEASRAAELAAQLSETAAMAEAKLAAEKAHGSAALRAAELAAAAAENAAKAQLSREQQEASGLRNEQTMLQARGAALEKQLGSAREEVDAWRAKASSHSAKAAAAAAEADATVQMVATYSAEMDKLMAERDDALRIAQRAAADLKAQSGLRDSLQARLDEMVAQVQAARASAAQSGPAGLTAAAAAAQADDVHGSDRMSSVSAKASAGLAAALGSMSIMEMKDWLTARGQADAVWALANRRPAPKRDEWAELVTATAGATVA
ncbi:hypothetical protein FOA52_002647 [Chlamydomonas sp. UWO 241]|nr:hypothetical protein FOA52_002647 [Chlamydomonas sp. UWO 241]